MRVQAGLLPDGRRLHLNHGPIDLVLEVSGRDPAPYYARAETRFQTILTGLVSELGALRLPLNGTFSGPVARRMAQAVAPYKNVFVTPMAAVAGAVADEVLAAMLAQDAPPKAYVNNGGDIAFHLSQGQELRVASAAGPVTITAQDDARGVATSGWQGRSHSRGIADAVTVVAPCAACADVAATLIANAVDLPKHPAIRRTPACELSPDSDLGARLVTTDVGALQPFEIDQALRRGAEFAARLCDDGLISQAALSLRGHTRLIAAPVSPPLEESLMNA